MPFLTPTGSKPSGKYHVIIVIVIYLPLKFTLGNIFLVFANFVPRLFTEIN